MEPVETPPSLAYGRLKKKKKKKKSPTTINQAAGLKKKTRFSVYIVVYLLLLLNFFFSLRAVCPINLQLFHFFSFSLFSSFPLFSQLSSPFVYPCRSLRQLKPLLYIDTPSLHTALGRSPSPASRRSASHSTLRTSAIPLDDTHTPLNITLCRLCSSIASPIDCFFIFYDSPKKYYNNISLSTTMHFSKVSTVVVASSLQLSLSFTSKP